MYVALKLLSGRAHVNTNINLNVQYPKTGGLTGKTFGAEVHGFTGSVETQDES